MATPSGYPSSKKTELGTGVTSVHTTVVPTDPYRNAEDNLRFAFRVGSGTVPRTATADTGQSPLNTIETTQVFYVGDTSTPARRGDFVRFIDGNAQYIEFPIVKVEANRFLISTIPDAAHTPQAGDQFYIMRYTTQRVDENGSQVVIAQPGPTQFVLDGNDVEVEEDTVNPANNKPLPTKLFDSTNLPVNPASQETLTDVETAITTLDTNIQAIDFATEAKQDAQITALGTINTSIEAVDTTLQNTDFATETTLATLEAKVLTDTQLRASPVPVSMASVPLPTGAATEAKQDAEITQLTNLNAKDFATQTTLAALNTKVANNFGAATGGVRTVAQVGNATGAADFGSGTVGAQTMRVVLPTDQPAIATKAPVNTNGSQSNTALTGTTASTATAPANAVGFIIQAPDDNTHTIRYRIGGTASTTAGMQLQPGRDSGYIPVAANVSICATASGTNAFEIQWILSQ